MRRRVAGTNDVIVHKRLEYYSLAVIERLIGRKLVRG